MPQGSPSPNRCSDWQSWLRAQPPSNTNHRHVSNQPLAGSKPQQACQPPALKPPQLRPQISWSRDKLFLLHCFWISDHRIHEHNKMDVVVPVIWGGLQSSHSNWNKYWLADLLVWCLILLLVMLRSISGLRCYQPDLSLMKFLVNISPSGFGIRWIVSYIHYSKRFANCIFPSAFTSWNSLQRTFINSSVSLQNSSCRKRRTKAWFFRFLCWGP